MSTKPTLEQVRAIIAAARDKNGVPRLNRANLTQVILSGASLAEANLTKAASLLNDTSFYLTRYDAATIWPGGFDPEAVSAINIDGLDPDRTTPL